MKKTIIILCAFFIAGAALAQKTTLKDYNILWTNSRH